MKKVLYITALFALSACGPRYDLVWSKSGATDESFKVDRHACLKEATTAAPPSAGHFGSYDALHGGYTRPIDVSEDMRNMLFDSCMESKGWTLEKKFLDPQLEQDNSLNLFR